MDHHYDGRRARHDPGIHGRARSRAVVPTASTSRAFATVETRASRLPSRLRHAGRLRPEAGARGANEPGYGAELKQALIAISVAGTSASGLGRVPPAPRESHHARSDTEGQVGHSRPAHSRAAGARTSVRWTRTCRQRWPRCSTRRDARTCTARRRIRRPASAFTRWAAARMSRTPRRGAQQVEPGVGREESLHDRRRVHGQHLLRQNPCITYMALTARAVRTLSTS